jgi:hypothetical protein
MAQQQNPFGTSGTGSNAFKAAYDRLKAEAEATKQGIAQDYGSAYQQLRQQGYGMGLGASAQSGLSGGQKEGMQQKISAQQMNSLGGLMQGQEKALREAKVGEQSIYSNALLEGQQAEQYDRETKQANLQVEQQSAAVIADKSLTDEQKTQQLTALGYNPQEIQVLIDGSKPGYDWGLAVARHFLPWGAMYNLYEIVKFALTPKNNTTTATTPTSSSSTPPPSISVPNVNF